MGLVIGTLCVTPEDDVMIITDKGQVIRLDCSQISTVGRNTQGVRLLNVKDGEMVSSIALVADEKDDISESTT